MIHVLVPHGRSPEMDGVVVHRCRRIDPVDIVQRADGIRLTSPPRTMFDSADMIGAEATTSVLEQLLNERRITFGTITDTVQRLYHPNRPGSSDDARRHPVASGMARGDCSLTSRSGCWTRCRGSSLADARRHSFRCVSPGYDHDIAIDFAWPSVKLAIEVDHPAWHDGAVESHADKGRDRKLTTIGWTTARITDIDVTGRSDADAGR